MQNNTQKQGIAMHTDADLVYLRQARSAAAHSKDPSTKTGAIVVTRTGSVFRGWNQLPPGIGEQHMYNREAKLARVIHCEVDAVWGLGIAAEGATLYTWPFMSCERCAALMVYAGVKRVVAPRCTDPDRLARWGAAFAVTRDIFAEAGVELVEVDYDQAAVQ